MGIWSRAEPGLLRPVVADRYTELLASGGFEAIRMTQPVSRGGNDLLTTRSPIRVDGQILTSTKAAPTLGEDNDSVRAEFPARAAAAAGAAGTAPAATATQEASA